MSAEILPPSHPNLVLVGFMGSGKSTVGAELAGRLAYRFVDTDSVIEAAHGPISAIFASEGEAMFRRWEREAVEGLAAQQRLVIATGGGTILDPASAAALERSGVVVWLDVSVDTVLERLEAAGELARRPLLGNDPRGTVERLLAERRAVYRRYPRVDTSGLSVSAVADEVLAAFSANQ